MRRTLRVAFWLLIPCWIVAFHAIAEAEPAVTPSVSARVYRISGVAMSSRDGSPIAHCKMSVTQTSRTGEILADDSGAPGRQNRQGPPDRAVGGGRPSLGRFPADSAGAQDAEPVWTDNQGRFTLTVTGPGMWRLTGAARGFRPQAYDEHENFWSGIVLTAAAPEIKITFKMTPESTLSGIVFDEAGEPVRNAQVTVVPMRPRSANEGMRGNGFAGMATTDDRGRYEVTGLAPGEYKLKVIAHPWYANGAGANHAIPGNTPSPDPSLDMVYPETWFPAAMDDAGAEVVALSGGEEREADFHLTALPSVHLIVPRVDPPAGSSSPQAARPPMVIREGGMGGMFVQSSPSSPNATEWDIGGLSPGTYQVRIPDAAGQGQRLAEVTIGAGSPSVVGLDAASATAVVALKIDGVEENQVRAVLFVNTATGQSYNSTGGRRARRPINGGDDEDPGSGERSISAPPGEYEVYLNGSQGLFLTGLSATGAKVTGRTIVLAGGTPKLTLHAATGMGEVSGIARREVAPTAGAMVLLVPAGYGKPENLAPVERDETNTDGSFLIRNVIPGPYILVAIDHGWDVNWRDSTILAQYLTKGTPIDLGNAATVKKEIEAVLP